MLERVIKERLAYMANECPRELGIKEHRLKRYYHVSNHSGITCVMDIMPRKELTKRIGAWWD